MAENSDRISSVPPAEAAVASEKPRTVLQIEAVQEDGSPVSGASFQVWAPGELLGSAVTDPKGLASFVHPEAHRELHLLYGFQPSGLCPAEVSTPCPVPEDGVASIRLIFSPGSDLTVHLEDADTKQPVSEGMVSLSPDGSDVSVPLRAHQDSFVLSGVPEGQYALTASSQGFQSVTGPLFRVAGKESRKVSLSLSKAVIQDIPEGSEAEQVQASSSQPPKGKKNRGRKNASGAEKAKSEAKSAGTRFAWHPPGTDGVELTWPADAQTLYVPERNLAKEPLRIDLLMLTDQKFRDPVGRFFSKVNIIVYKPPGGTFNMREYHKAFAYAHLYKAECREQSEISDNEITITSLSHAAPLGLLAKLGERAKESKFGPAIYQKPQSTPPESVASGGGECGQVCFQIPGSGYSL